jgi:hypothetical protein
MRSFPEEEKKQPPRQADKPVSPALGLGLVAFFLGLPFVGKMLGGILLVFGIILRAFSGALKEFFSAAPTTAAVLTGICIGLRLYYRFRGSSNNEETKAQQSSAGTSAEEAPAPQIHHTFNP